MAAEVEDANNKQGLTAEAIIEKFMEMLGTTEQEKVPELLETLVKGFSMQKKALEKMGSVSIIVVPGGAFQFIVSPNLIDSLAGLDALENALDDVRESIRKYRDRLIEKEVERRTQKAIEKAS